VCMCIHLFSQNSSLGGHRQKLMDALNSVRIWEGAKPKQFQDFFLKIGDVWNELENDKNGHKQKPIGVLNLSRLEKMLVKISQNCFAEKMVRSGKS
jgi:hypothetical protein